MPPETPTVTQRELHALNVGLGFATLSTIGALLVVVDARTVPEAALLGTGLVAALVAVRWWTSTGPVLGALLVTAVVWVVGVLVTGSSTASWGLAVVGSVLVLQRPRHRRRLLLGLVGYAVAVVVLRVLLDPADTAGTLLRHGVGAGGVALGAVVTTVLYVAVQRVLAELEASRGRQAELAVARERVRFASDLHDIQGHTLHVVKLKVALSRRLLHDDLDRVEQELAEVHALVGDTIARTKELAHAQRRLNLAVELENAKNLFEAAGIRVEVQRSGEVEPGVGELLGQVLRETTTNVLRHTRATRVRIVLTSDGIAIDNDGAADEEPELSGLAVLRDRVAGAGGELVVRGGDGTFRTAATLPRPHADASTPVLQEERR
ncbi:sensor histidine kinase [Auraticoccus monumenti]|uniref:Two-component system, NarL family, sensor histidine kinase DesK n=1 Tax=Auraticoccus monumenti TaxID=675864 RepID=A0A1G6TRJ6_9ACTN|nr:histidine kinase [Auraticoccus monumenti]SDD31534.1 two-component system, NarL family, sensor histidine kinase DesK [Auraticoccus monumenti]